MHITTSVEVTQGSVGPESLSSFTGEMSWSHLEEIPTLLPGNEKCCRNEE